MISAFFKTLAQVRRGYFIKVAGLQALISIILFCGVVFGLGAAGDYFAGDIDSWYGGWIKYISGAGGLVLGYFLIPVIFPVIGFLFQDFVIKNLCEQEGKNLNAADFKTMIVVSAKFLAVSLGLNLVLLPFYFVPVIGQIAYFLVNSFLIGKDYNNAIKLTLHNTEKNVNSNTVTGAVISAIFLLPVVNLFAPIFGTIFAYYRTNK